MHQSNAWKAKNFLFFSKRSKLNCILSCDELLTVDIVDIYTTSLLVTRDSSIFSMESTAAQTAAECLFISMSPQLSHNF